MNLKQAYKILEENKRTYNEISDEFNQTRRKYSSEFEDLKKYIIQGEKVLDLGCGNGRLYEFFSGRNIDYTGVDFSENLIRIAKEKYGDKFVEGDILNLPFSEQKFDSVWSIAVLHHHSLG
jgi:ubiquinone/menaquinone biosynthesis C-methylase UbiE